MPSGPETSIRYNLSGSTKFVSFPFSNKNYTPETLNEALGGTIGGNPRSSSLIGKIIGESEMAVFITGDGFRGNLQTISPDKSYWIFPYTGSFDSTATIIGRVRTKDEKYLLSTGWNMTSYPFAENNVFGEAVITKSGENSLQDNGIKDIIGNGTAATFTDDLGWVGSLVSRGFESGSGYWFKSDQLGLKTLYKSPSISETGSQEKYVHCPREQGTEIGKIGYNCTNMNSAYVGYDSITKFPYSASGHTFGYKQTQIQNWCWWADTIGVGPSGQKTGSLLDSASNDMSGAADGTNNFIVGLFPHPSGSTGLREFPTCCGAVAWHHHENAWLQHLQANLDGDEITGWEDNQNNVVELHTCGDDPAPPYEQFQAPNPGETLFPKIYDPRRNIVVTGSVFRVNVSNQVSTIGEEVTLEYQGNNTTRFFATGSVFQMRYPSGNINPVKPGMFIIKMDS